MTAKTVQLETICNSTPTANALFYGLATKKRNKSRTDMRRLFADLKKEGFNPDYKEYLHALRDLEQAGVLSLDLGKNSIHAEWKQPLTYVGLVGLGEARPIRPDTPKPTAVPTVLVAPPKFVVISAQASEDDIKAAISALRKGVA